MKTESERKFLVNGDDWRAASGAEAVCCQGYITSEPSGATVRVRLLGEQGFLTIKGPTQGISRPEMEYKIPSADAEYLIENLCGDRLVSKIRHTLDVNGVHWEIDEFRGANEGLILAEIELDHEDQAFEKPAWLGREVTRDDRYYNAALARRPFRAW